MVLRSYCRHCWPHLSFRRPRGVLGLVLRPGRILGVPIPADTLTCRSPLSSHACGQAGPVCAACGSARSFWVPHSSCNSMPAAHSHPTMFTSSCFLCGSHPMMAPHLPGRLQVPAAPRLSTPSQPGVVSSALPRTHLFFCKVNSEWEEAWNRLLSVGTQAWVVRVLSHTGHVCTGLGYQGSQPHRPRVHRAGLGWSCADHMFTFPYL